MPSPSLATQRMTPTYFRLLLRNLGLPRGQIEKALASVELSPSVVADLDRPVTVSQQLELFAHLVRQRPADGWLRAGRRFHVGTHGSLGVAFMSAPDVKTSLEILERFGPVRLPYARPRTASLRGGRYALGFDVTPKVDPRARVAMMEVIAVVRKHLLDAVTGEPISGVTFEFDYPAPRHASLYEDELGVPVRFDRPRTAMIVPESLLRRPCTTADAEMFRAAVERLERRARQLEGSRPLAAHVEELLDSAGDAGLPVDEAARALGMSRRSLARHLTEAGTSYRALHDRHRRTRAEALLRDSSLDVNEIAWRLGYGNAANFGRATRRWFGMPPGKYRQSIE